MWFISSYLYRILEYDRSYMQLYRQKAERKTLSIRFKHNHLLCLRHGLTVLNVMIQIRRVTFYLSYKINNVCNSSIFGIEFITTSINESLMTMSNIYCSLELNRFYVYTWLTSTILFCSLLTNDDQRLTVLLLAELVGINNNYNLD